MNAFEFEKLIKEGKLKEALEYLKKDIEIAEHYNALLKNASLTEAPLIYQAIQVISALYGVFVVAKNILETERTNIEDKKYLEIKNKGEKNFTSTSAKKEASYTAYDYKRLENLIEGYVEMTHKNVSTCQSLLSFHKEAIKGNIE